VQAGTVLQTVGAVLGLDVQCGRQRYGVVRAAAVHVLLQTPKPPCHFHSVFNMPLMMLLRSLTCAACQHAFTGANGGRHCRLRLGPILTFDSVELHTWRRNVIGRLMDSSTAEQARGSSTSVSCKSSHLVEGGSEHDLVVEYILLELSGRRDWDAAAQGGACPRCHPLVQRLQVRNLHQRVQRSAPAQPFKNVSKVFNTHKQADPTLQDSSGVAGVVHSSMWQVFILGAAVCSG